MFSAIWWNKICAYMGISIWPQGEGKYQHVGYWGKIQYCASLVACILHITKKVDRYNKSPSVILASYFSNSFII